ncbi:tartrate dehydrogenase [Acidomonas methanolica]|uniref:D-malate dehydrogenase [decarboxylating] n=1 Tax=Acidomonas methanolica NBRC 104435 TaxID=1231351 RepID=A0A023D0D4_ACIMT|nr:tartrate dehydrogenase [Acidomonas methanolica]MBU2654133.1 tartrate dehydrogenase [Acidomonas methanolica]TCS30639.1 tartrate dehydrogenase/decarboxylase/D-malate dehydrogenase [Acidomonas methanolica]GAJ27597.1 3-isopropylmalate/isocitrate dehydrogenase [Acidomonas methanolica NBRC 104435]GBQ52009.1 tartrate dehydrogenase [Acidomonas methanolica]GEK98801.1 tartrate dehydrogenase [Acidomonas methanolica NBRC 104435]
MTRHRIAVLPGDGIGREVMPEALKILGRIGDIFDMKFEFSPFDWSCETWLATGRMMPPDGMQRLSQHDAILLGAVGYPSVPDHISLWGMLIPIRRDFDQYVNLRPVRLLPGIPCPLAGRGPGDIDFWIVRENTEGEYSQIGGRFAEGSAAEGVAQTAIFTRRGTDRIMRYAFDLASRLDRPHVSSATKSNGLFHSMPYWDERFAKMAAEYPQVRTDVHHIDILAARFVMNPDRFDIVVGSNLFGDILSDLGPGVTGTIAVAPSANINPEKRFPSMFEPVHGSAPDIAGRNIANPIGQIWAASMMLDHLGESEAAALVLCAIECVTADPSAAVRTADIGGHASTSACGDAIVAALDRIA